MTKIYKLNAKDIKELIAKEFGVKADKIRGEYFGSSQDGPYYSPGGCFFEFEKEIDLNEKIWRLY